MANRKALIVGATGLIGGFCLQALLDDPRYSEVTALVRSPLLQASRKLRTFTVKLCNLENELSRLQSIQTHDVFCCLGTTIKKAGSQEAFKQVDLSMVIKVAELGRRQGAEQFLVISSMGANKDSKVFYSQVKGEMEQALKELGYPCLRIIRLSLLLGSRDVFRLGEKIGGLLAPVVKPFMFGSLRKYRPVQA